MSATAISEADLTFCVAVVNQLLAQCGISHTITSISECSPSLFVLLFEGLFHFRLPNIHRERKQTSAEKLHNMQELISTMEWTVGFSLRHIDAQSILDGEPKHLCLLIQIFKELCHIQATQQRRHLQLRRPPTPLPVFHGVEPEYAEDGGGESQTDEAVSQWCDTVLRESNLTAHIREVVSLNPDYCVSTSSTPQVVGAVQLMSLAAHQQRQTGQRLGDGSEPQGGLQAEEEPSEAEPQSLLHPRPLTAIPALPLPGTLAALRQPHLSPHAFLPMPKPHGEAAQPLEEQGTMDFEQLFDYPQEGSFQAPSSAAAARRAGPALAGALPPALQHALRSLSMAQLEALLQDSQRPPAPPSDLPPSLDHRIPTPHPGPPPSAPSLATAPPGPAAAPGSPPRASAPAAPAEAPPSSTTDQPPRQPEGKPARPEGTAKRQRQTSPAVSQRPSSGPSRARPVEKAPPPTSAPSAEAVRLRIVGDEKRNMLRARRALESHQQQIHATVCSRKESEQAALLKLFQLLLKRERMRVSEERGQLRRQQREADQERTTQQAALETYFVTQHQMLTEEFRRAAECRRAQEKNHKQALEKLRREARDRQLLSLEEYYQKLRSQEDAKFYRSSLESVMRAFACSAG